MKQEVAVLGEAISKSPLNHSKAKNMYSFNRDQRFKVFKSHANDHFYNLPDVKNKRAASIGYGNKYDFTKDHKGKSQVYYNISKDFDPKKSQAPAYTFGMSRSFYEKVYCEANKPLDKNVPGPAKFNITKPFGSEASKFSMTGKGFDYFKKSKASNEPGPGDYKYTNINKEGRYALSQYKNTSSISFNTLDKRFNYTFKDRFPAPNAYKLRSLIDGKGFVFDSKIKSSPANSIIGKGTDISKKFTNYNTPGPGSYRTFSEFGIYPKITIKKSNNKKL